MNENIRQPEPDPTTPVGFIAYTDRALAAWADRVESTEDLRMAIAYGQLLALFELGAIADRFEGPKPFVDIAELWAAGYLARASRRDAVRFPRMIERARAESPETHEGGSPPCSTT